MVSFSPGITNGVTRQKQNLVHQNQKCLSRFYIKFPGEETNWLTFVQPFSANLWVVLGSFLAMVSALLKVSYLFGCEKNPESFTSGSSLIVIWGSWLLQGSSVDPKSIPSRIIILFSFFFGLIIYTAYSAKLISFLSVSKPSLPFSTMKNLLETRQYSVGLTRGSAFYSLFFEAPPGSLYKRVAEELVAEDDLVDSMAQGVDRTLRNNYAFVWDTISMPERDGCQILEIPLDLDSNIVAMAWNSRLPHRHILHHFFDKIRESGQLFTFTVYFHFLLSRSTFSFYFHFLLTTIRSAESDSPHSHAGDEDKLLGRGRVQINGVEQHNCCFWTCRCCSASGVSYFHVGTACQSPDSKITGFLPCNTM